jgi:hypothetical protein
MATFGTFTDGQVLSASELNSAGAFSNYTPTWTQSVAITKTVLYGHYTQLNDWVYAAFYMTATSAGTANNLITCTLPVTASSENKVIGTGMLVDASAASGTLFPLLAWMNTTTTVSFYANSANQTGWVLGGAGFTASSVAVTIASGDIIAVNLVYRTA